MKILQTMYLMYKYNILPYLVELSKYEVAIEKMPYNVIVVLDV